LFQLGYNTNGLAHHRVLDALDLLADLGFEGVAITPDVGQLDPLHLDRRLVREVRARANALGLGLAIETGARFVLDPRRKHFPSLLEDDARDRARRLDFLVRCVDLAQELEASIVSIWAGRAPGDVIGDARGAPDAHDALYERLSAELCKLLEYASGSGVQIAFEPEPGMFIERPAGYLRLVDVLAQAGDRLGLCLDVGHLLVTKDLPVGRIVRDYAPRLVHVHLDDIAGGVHEHCMFGSGDLDLEETLSALLEVGYDGMAAVELSRDAHRGAEAAREAMQHLRRALGSPG